MSSSKDEPQLSDDQCRHILMTVKQGYGDGFPMDNETGEMIGWYDWLRSTIRNDLLKNRDKK